MKPALPTAPAAYGLKRPSAANTVDNATPQASLIKVKKLSKHMGPALVSVALSKYIIKFAVLLIFKILCKEQGSIPARTTGEVLQGHTGRYRFALHNCPPEGGCKLKQLGFISFDQTTGDLFVTRTHPIRET